MKFESVKIFKLQNIQTSKHSNFKTLTRFKLELNFELEPYMPAALCSSKALPLSLCLSE